MPNRPQKPPTLREIAQATGLALSTVSSALRDQPGVAPATVRKVREKAEAMGWRPNPMVSAWLSHVRTSSEASNDTTLAYVVSAPGGLAQYHANSDTYHAYLEGARDRAVALGFSLEEFHYEAFGGARLSQILDSRGIPGVIVAPKEDWSTAIELDWDRLAAAAIAYSMAQPVLARAASHHFHSVYLAVNKLHEYGYRRIGIILNESLEFRADNMFTGGYWSAAYKLFDTPLPPYLSSDESFKMDSFKSWLHTNKPDALIGFAHMLPWVQAAGLDIPEKIAFVDLVWHPKHEHLAGINQHPRQIGAAAVDLVSARIYRNERGITEHPKLSLIGCDWVDGASVPNIS